MAVGFRKALTNYLTVKTKVDSSMNASIFTDYKCGNGLSVQSTVATNFKDDFRSKGFLENNFALGVKLKYES